MVDWTGRQPRIGMVGQDILRAHRYRRALDCQTQEAQRPTTNDQHAGEGKGTGRFLTIDSFGRRDVRKKKDEPHCQFVDPSIHPASPEDKLSTRAGCS